MSGDEILSGRDIAVIGLSGRFPGARDLTRFWQNLRDGIEAVTFFSDEELAAAGVDRALLADPHYIKAASRLDGVAEFDAPFFGYTAREAEILDPQQRLFLEHAWDALENAGYDPARYDGLIGVYAGVAWNTYLLSNLTTRPELFDGGGAFQVFITNDKDFMPTRVSYKLNLRGPSLILQTSCSTSLVAIHLACLSLLSYECDMALAGGVTVKVPQTAGYFYQEGGLASPDGHCRAFDVRAAGTIFGSGIGLVVLKRLSEALADGDTIHAVVKGSAINNDGSLKVSYTAPAVEGQAAVIAAAQAVAGVEADSIRYVECHGTGTSLGDPVEVTALSKAFRETTARNGFCALGSVKTNVGHLDAAAGVAGFLKAVLALEHREIPPSLHFETPNPAIDFAASPFYVNSRLTPWEAGPLPRRAGVSSFGVGGTNAHVILEEAPAAPKPAASRPVQLLLLSARSEAALEAATDRLAGHLRAHPDLDLADLAHTLRVGRAVFRHRRAVVCRGLDDAVARLESRDPAAVATAADPEDPRARPVVFLFPGQGAQHAGMARGLYEDEPVFRRELDRCAELLRPRLGLDLRPVLFAADGGPLARTALTQPALFAVEYALARLWMDWGVQPQAMIGHSLGEYVAACLAGVMALPDALALVAARGRLIERLPEGAMLSVPLPEDELLPLLPEGVSLAAVNEPARSVASGPPDAVAELARRLDAKGIGHRRLHTSHAFHSALMDPVLPELAAAVRGIALRPPEIPYISNLTGTWITPGQATDPDYWARHLRQPVRFAAGIEELLRDPARILLEVGPGRTLTTLAGRHPARSGQPVIASLRHPDEETGDQEALLAALGRLWLAGLSLDWSGFQGGERRSRVPLPGYPFERQTYWIEPRERGAEAVADDPAAAVGKELVKEEVGEWFYLQGWRMAPLGPPRPSPPSPLPPALTPARERGAATQELENREGGGSPSPGWRECGWERGPGGEGPSSPRWLVLSSQPDGFAARLAQRLAESGRTVTLSPEIGDSQPDIVIDTRSLGESGDLPGAGFYGFLELARELGRRPSPVELVVLSDRLLAVTDGEPLAPGKAALLGLCRVLPQEHAHLSCRVIDIAPPSTPRREAALLDHLIADLEAPSGDEQVAWRGHQRWVPAYEKLRLAETAPPPERSVWLITGGPQGPAYALAQTLARAAKARLAFFFSPPLPGAEVLLLEADLADEAAARRAVAAVEERFGAIYGVIHAAGTEELRLIQDSPEEDWRRAFQERLGTLLGLEKALAGRAPEVCLLVSSLATVLGGVAYGASTASAAVLDAFARDRAQGGELPWRSLGWDAWEMEDRPAALAMTREESGEAFLRALAAPGVDHLLISTGNLEARITRRRRRDSLHAAASAPEVAAILHPRPLQTPYIAPETDLERRLAAVWERVLGFAPIGVQDNFFELGGDSFVAIQVVSRLNQELAINLPVARLYQGLTIRALAALLETESGLPARRTAQLDERREAMERRRAFQEKRRSGRAGVGVEDA